MEPLGRVAHVKGDKLEGDGKVDEVKVKVVDSEVGQALAGGELDMLAAVVRVPKLGGDPELLARDEPRVDRHLDPLADLDLVAVVAGRVDVPVPRLDRLDDAVGRRLLGDLPAAVAHGGHANAARAADLHRSRLRNLLLRGLLLRLADGQWPARDGSEHAARLLVCVPRVHRDGIVDDDNVSRSPLWAHARLLHELCHAEHRLAVDDLAVAVAHRLYGVIARVNPSGERGDCLATGCVEFG